MRQQAQERLREYLAEQIDFLQASCSRWDDGCEHEAKRIAVHIRVLLHDTNGSHSLLGQLDLKDRLGWIDTAAVIPFSENLLVPFGLVTPVFDDDGSATFVPILNTGPRGEGEPAGFEKWWNTALERAVDAAARERAGKKGSWSRRDFILGSSNKDGGAHVDPDPERDWTLLRDEEFLGALKADRGAVPIGNLVSATVRQLGWEVPETLHGLSLLTSGDLSDHDESYTHFKNESPVPEAAFDPTFRRMDRPRGPLRRRSSGGGNAKTEKDQLGGT